MLFLNKSDATASAELFRPAAAYAAEEESPVVVLLVAYVLLWSCAVPELLVSAAVLSMDEVRCFI